MTFVWVAIFYGFDPSIHVFRRLHNLVMNKQSNADHGPGWWRIESKKGILTTWPNDTSDKDWRGQWIWVRAPYAAAHPNYFGGPRYLSKPDKNMSAIGSADLSSAELELLNLFDKLPTGKRGRELYMPKNWLPCYHYIFQEKILAAVGLSRKYQREK